MHLSSRPRYVGAAAAVVAATAVAAAVGATSGSAAKTASPTESLNAINHIVVIYEENHSFDNLYGSWEGVNGLANADAAHTTQVDQAGNAVRVPAPERRQPHARRR